MRSRVGFEPAIMIDVTYTSVLQPCGVYLIYVKETSQLVLLSSNLPLMDRWNVHQRGDRVLAETIDSSFTLREKHSTSSSKLSCVSLLKHKDGTRTIEMILKSTVLILTMFFWCNQGRTTDISCGSQNTRQLARVLLSRNGSRRVLQTLHSRRYFTTSSGILGKVFN